MKDYKNLKKKGKKLYKNKYKKLSKIPIEIISEYNLEKDEYVVEIKKHIVIL